MNIARNRDNSIDLFKFVASIVVVFMHTSPLHSFSRLLNYYVINLLGRPMVLMFFVISGYYMYKNGIPKIDIIKHSFNKMIKMYLVWMAVYFIPLWYESGLQIKEYLPEYGRKLILNDTHLWYVLNTIIGSIILYLFVRNSNNFSQKRLLYISIPIAIVGALILSYEKYICAIPVIKNIAQEYYSIFGELPNAFFVGFPYLCLGVVAALSKTDNSKKI